jgi:predicted short-subunit dehydrogenase-like oxidoreductase (DUF2520 family)
MGTEKLQSLKIVIFGAGNVAYHLSQSLKSKGHSIVQVISRSKDNAKQLAEILGCDYNTSISEVYTAADLYILAIPDSSICDLSKSLPKLSGLVVHTSGSTPMSVLESLSPNYGVFYPFQTFSKVRNLSLVGVPMCIESSNVKSDNLLTSLAANLGALPIKMDSKKRQMLHLAGVFSCNFVNHLLAISQVIAEENDLDFQLLNPLVNETIAKAMESSPFLSQTGPAVRGDSDTIKKHIAILSKLDDDIRDLYLSLSTSILNLKQSLE